MDMSQQASLAKNATPAEPASHAAPEGSRTENRQAAVALAIIALAIAGWAVSGFLFGIVGIAMPALAMVPVIFVTLILIARG